MNPKCWSYGIDITCASMWHCGLAWNIDCHPTNTTVTAISPRHVIYANHFAYAMNTNLIYCFMGSDGVVSSNRLIRFEGIGSDIGIGLLEDELPTAVHPAKFLPDDFGDYLGNGSYLPIMTIDQNEWSLIHDLSKFTFFGNKTERVSTNCSRILQRSQYYKSFIGGDSSSPRFLVIGDQVVLLGTVWKAGGGGCCNANLFKNEIQAKMDMMCGGYRVEVIDLSAFDKVKRKE